MIQIEEIRSEALRLGACDKVAEVGDTNSLVELFFSSQGLEFAQKSLFPDLTLLRRHKEQLRSYGIWIDCGQIELDGRDCICIAGDTQAVIDCKGSAFIHRIVVMHGARADIHASEYAVVAATNIAAADIRISSDATAVIL